MNPSPEQIRSRQTAIGIGSTLWLFDGNRRVYGPDRRTVYREHFRPIVVFGETKQSWLCGEKWAPIRVNKKTMQTKGEYGVSPHVFTSKAEIDDDCWLHDKRRDIDRALMLCNDPAVLRQIAALLGVI